MEKTQSNKMGTAPITPLIWKMALPAMLSMMVQALYNIVDSIFVAKISSQAFNAISIAFPIQMLMISLAIGTGIGINSLVSRRLGENRKKEADSAATHGIILGLFSWLIMVLVGVFGATAFFTMTTDNQAVIEMGTQYIQIVTVFSFGSFLQINIEKTLQATGNMIFPMFSQLLGCVINIILDPILIFGLLGAPKLGIRGAAIATVTGQIFAMIFCFIIILVKNHDVHISFKKFKFSFRTIRDIYEVGIPAIIMQAISSVLVTLLNMILITFSDAAVNVLGIYYKLQSFVFMPVFGLTQGVMPVLGYNFGACNKDRILKALKVGLTGAVCIMTLGTILFWVFPDFLLTLFSADEETMILGRTALRFVSFCFVPAAIGIMLSTFFQACGMGMKSLLISLIRQLICILPAAYLLSKISVHAIWFSFPISEVVASVISVFFFFDIYKKTIKNLTPIDSDEE